MPVTYRKFCSSDVWYGTGNKRTAILRWYDTRIDLSLHRFGKCWSVKIEIAGVRMFYMDHICKTIHHAKEEAWRGLMSIEKILSRSGKVSTSVFDRVGRQLK